VPRLLALCNTGCCLAIAVLMIGMGASLVHYAHTRQALADYATASAQLLAALPPEQAQQANFARDTLATVVRLSPAPSLLAVHLVDADATVVQQYPGQADASSPWSPLADGRGGLPQEPILGLLGGLCGLVGVGGGGRDLHAFSHSESVDSHAGATRAIAATAARA